MVGAHRLVILQTLCGLRFFRYIVHHRLHPGRETHISSPTVLERYQMIYEHAELRINPGTEEEFLKETAAVRSLLLAARGCHSVELQASVDIPGTYLLRVGWQSIEDHTVVFPGTAQAEDLYKILLAHCVEAPHVVHFSGQDVLNPQ